MSEGARSAPEWVLLAFRLPREPSTPRISVWRKLRRLGAVQVLGGLVALPKDARTVEQLGWVADEVLEAGGEAFVFEAQPGSRSQERELIERMRAEVAESYRAVATEAEALFSADGGTRLRGLGRLRRDLRRIRRRDYFPPLERAAAERALDELATSLEGEVVR